MEVNIGLTIRGQELLVLAVVVFIGGNVRRAAPTITVAVDASRCSAQTDPCEVTYSGETRHLDARLPKWIPGKRLSAWAEITDFDRLMFTAMAPVAAGPCWTGWTHIHVEVLAGEQPRSGESRLCSPAQSGGEYTAGLAAMESLTLELVYAQALSGGLPSDDRPTTRACSPAGWKSERRCMWRIEAGSEIILLDFADDAGGWSGAGGRVLEVVPLSTENPPAELDIAADSAAAPDAR